MPLDPANIRHALLQRLGEGVPKPTSVGAWLVHEYLGEPYVVYVQPGADEDALHFRLTPAPTNPWYHLDNEWATVEYPETDILCWKIE